MKATALLSRLAVGVTIGLATLGSALPVSATSQVVQQATDPALAVPSGLAANAGPDGIEVTWDATKSAEVTVTASARDDQGMDYHCSASLSEGSCVISVPGGGRYVVSALATDLVAQVSSDLVDLGEVAVPVVDPPVVDPAPLDLPGLGGWTVTAEHDSAVSVSWNPLSRDDLYLVVWAEDVSGNRTGYCWAMTADGSCEVADLTNGTTYSLFYAVTDGLRFSEATKVAEATPSAAEGAQPPAAPAGVYTYQVATSGELGARVYVGWAPSASDGGAPVNRYEVTASNSSGEVAATCRSSRWAEGCQLEGLAFGEPYVVSVVAINSAGASEPGLAELSGLVAPPAPSSVDAWGLVASDSVATVTWDPLAAAGNATVVAWAQDAAGNSGSSCWATLAEGRCEIGDLENGTAYQVSVLLVDGWNNYQTVELGTTTPEAAVGAEPPSPPSNVTVYQQQGWPWSFGYSWRSYPAYLGGGQSAAWTFVAWTASEHDGGAPVKRYEVTATNSSGEVAATCRSSRWAEGCQLEGLAIGERYVVSVVAINSAGASEPGFAEPFTVEPPSVLPALFGLPEVFALPEGGYLVRWSVEDAQAYPGLGFIVGSDQGAYCFASYEVGSGEASCVLNTAVGSPPTGVYVGLDELRYLLGGPDPVPEARGGTAGSVGDQLQTDAGSSSTVEVSETDTPQVVSDAAGLGAAGGEAVAGQDRVGDAPAPRELAVDLAVEQAGSRSELLEGSATVVVLLVLLAMVVPLLRRRRG